MFDFGGNKIKAESVVGLTEDGIAEANNGYDSVLARLQGGRRSVSSLAQECGLSVPTMVMTVNSLVKRGLVRPVGGGL